MQNDMERLIDDNRNLIYSISHYFASYQDKEDLFQIGVIGLIKAYQNYRSGFSTKFSTYAYPYIFGEMKKYVREDRSVKVSRELQGLSLRIEKASMLLAQRFMREPTNQELSTFLEVPISLIDEAMCSNNYVQSIDDDYGDGINLHEIISDAHSTDIDDVILIRDALESLPENDRRLIVSRYMDDLTQSETGKKLGMSQVQVSRYENKVLKKIRNGLNI